MEYKKIKLGIYTHGTLISLLFIGAAILFILKSPKLFCTFEKLEYDKIISSSS